MKNLLILILLLLPMQVMAKNYFHFGHSLLKHTSIDTAQMTDSMAEDLGKAHSHKIQITPGATMGYNHGVCETDPTDPYYDPDGAYKPGYTYCWQAYIQSETFDEMIMMEQAGLTGKVSRGTSQAAALHWYEELQDHNPGAQAWLSQVWGDVDSTFVSNINTELALHETIVNYVNTNKSGGPGMKLIPVANAFVALKTEIDAGNVPGITDITDMLDDNIHHNWLGGYFIAAVTFSALYNESPIGATETLLNKFGNPFPGAVVPTAAQALKFQQVAYDAWITYEGSPPAPIDQTINPLKINYRIEVAICPSKTTF